MDTDVELAEINETASFLRDDESQGQSHRVAGETTPKAEPDRPTAFLDGLRGLAALLVYLSHQQSWWYGPQSELNNGFGYHGQMGLGTFPFIRNLLTGGNAGVAVFFVLSGYVLSIAPLRVIRDGDIPSAHRRLASAFVRRPFRLFIPTLSLSFTLALIMHLPFGLAPKLEWPTPKATVWEEIQSWVSESMLMMNPFQKHGIFTRWYPYNPPAWTMAVEYGGSLLVFGTLAVAAVAPRYRMSIFSITGIFLFIIKQWSMACFMGGVVLAINDIDGIDRAFLGKRVSKQMIKAGHTLLFFWAWWLLGQPAGTRNPELSYGTPGWYFMTMLIPRHYFNDEYWRFWNTIGAVLLVYTVLRLQWLQAFFLTRRLQYLGRISFSFYLLHMPIIWTIGDRICRLFGVKRQDFTTWYDDKLAIPDIGPRGFSTGYLVQQALILPLTILLAEFCTRLLDGPSIRIGRGIAARLGLEKSSVNQRRLIPQV